ncbi:MAG: ester cyclase [Janthinobacterium lividum]
MSKEANIATQKKMGEIINSYEFDRLKEVMAPGVKDHDPADDQGAGPEGFAKWFSQFHSAFPDFKIAVEHMLADEDNVGFAYTITGTHGGPFNGIPATGKKIKVRGMQISKFNSDAKIVERWGASHEIGILQQIGTVKPVAHLDQPPAISAPSL